MLRSDLALGLHGNFVCDADYADSVGGAMTASRVPVYGDMRRRRMFGESLPVFRSGNGVGGQSFRSGDGVGGLFPRTVLALGDGC